MLGKVFESIVLHAEAADPDAIAPDKRKATGSYYTPRIVVHFICQEVLYQYLLSHLPGDGWGPRLKALFSLDPTEGIDEEAKQLLKEDDVPGTGSPGASTGIAAEVLRSCGRFWRFPRRPYARAGEPAPTLGNSR